MTKHSTSLEIERRISATEAAPSLQQPLLRGKGEGRQAPALAGEAAVVAPPARKGRLRPALLAAAGIAAATGAAWFGWQYWTVGRFQISTDDAYIQADNTTIAPKVSGYIAAVLVGDNQPVKAGQVLARIDDRDFRVALDQAKADVAAARAAIASKQASLDAQQSLIEAAKATVTVDQANLTFAQQDDRRYSALASNGFGSVQNAQQASARIAAGRAAVERDTASLVNATKQVDLLKAQLAQAQATLAHDEAVQDQAELNLSYTNVVAPVDGVVGNRTLRVGQYVQAGTQLMAVVPLAAAYVVANYKETQLTGVRPGQAADIDVDMFPGVTFHGHVDSIAPASGQEFALLPPDNATGNFTKVVQRIPVKIVLDAGNPLAGGLRPGMSVYPTIETGARS
ncbi:HlyD family secretion protein [Labrys monachus]|uniref:Membrane fusion protein (Multidrug efflux system) n=1 Tax=Labrys monachus TaxID=217067 RepID=A0ABU0FH91_9HYPH|nr:HlyD family secretion protein [Labrys monachus]MDQ0393987.1 membrane fusion protein (multidrug efflux system) [Labrys monachus]